MPIYEYVCDKCQTPFEKLVLNKQQEIACPKCASKKNTLQLSVFSASTNGAASKSSTSFSGSGGGGCCGGGCGCN
jgi:putative FmdB family regulatory protein